MVLASIGQSIDVVTVFLFLSDFNDLNNVARLECERISVIEKNVTIPIFGLTGDSTLPASLGKRPKLSMATFVCHTIYQF